MAQKILNGVHISGTVQLDFMPTHESEGIITLGRFDSNTSRYHNIKSYVSSTEASNYLKFSLHNGTTNTVVDVLTLNGNKNATFAGNVDAAGNVEARGYLQAFGSLFMRGTTKTMNKAGDGFVDFLVRDTSGAETVMNISNAGSGTFSSDVTAQGFHIDAAALQSFQDFQSKPIDTNSGLFTVGGHGMSVGYSRAISLWSTTAGVYRSWVGTNLRWDGTNYRRATNAQNNNWGNIAGIQFWGNNAATGKAIEFIIDPPENSSGGSQDATIGTSLPAGYTALTINNDLSATFAGNITCGQIDATLSLIHI